MKPKQRILIIGLDGFSWQVGNRLIQEGHMPTLAGLKGKGCYGNLKSVVPYETSPAWSSFQTGCFPGKTGIFGFHAFHRKTREINLNNFNDIQVPTLWELASNKGKKVVSINMPMTCPPPKVNGIIIPGLTCPELSSETVWPADVYDRYIKKYPGYQIVHKENQGSLQDYVKHAILTEQTRCQLALEVLKATDWDIFCVEIQSTDSFQHKNWWSLEPSATGFSKDAFTVASQFYRSVDNSIKQLTSAVDSDTTIFVVSDHGFCGKKNGISINAWLAQNGYLHLNSFKSHQDPWVHLKKNFPLLKTLTRLLSQVTKRTPFLGRSDQIRSELYSEVVMRHIRELIDLERSSAFCLGGLAGLLYINPTKLKLSPKIVEGLLSAYGPKSKAPLISTIQSTKDVYESTGQQDSLPDFLISLVPGVAHHIQPTGPIIIPQKPGDKQTGTHDPNGIFLVAGKDVKKNFSINADIVDMTPTILGCLNIPIPNYIEGKVLQDLFKCPLEVHYSQTALHESKGQRVYSSDEQSAVEKQLRDLGYL